MISSVSSVPFSGHDVQVAGIERREEFLVVIECDHFGRYLLAVEVAVERIGDGAVEYPDLFAIQRVGIDGGFCIGIVFNKGIRFVAHWSARITDKRCSVFLERQARQKVYVTIQKLLVERAEIVVYVFVFPPGVFGKLAIILVSVACLHSVVSSTFLEDLVFVIADAHRFRIVLICPGCIRRCGDECNCAQKSKQDSQHEKRPCCFSSDGHGGTSSHHCRPERDEARLLSATVRGTRSI